MLLYHFTDIKTDILKIDFFGKNYFTKNDSQYPQKRLFFYDTNIPLEHNLKGNKYQYTVNINENDIYNLDSDILNLKTRFNYDINDILEYIAKNYVGCKYTTSFLCYCVFKDIKPIARHEYINKQYV